MCFKKLAQGPIPGLAGFWLLSCSAVSVAGPGPAPDWPADYHPAHSIIKCPYLEPGLGADEIPRCNGIPVTCMGTKGHDLIIGSDKDDVIAALDGNDTVLGDEGNDLICGGPGNDAIHGAKGDDHLLGNDGDDFLFGARGNDTLNGGDGDFDVLWGGPGYDKLDGGPGNFDACMLQRELGEYDKESCNTVYPPPGYVHGEEPDPGILRALELPKSD